MRAYAYGMISGLMLMGLVWSCADPTKPGDGGQVVDGVTGEKGSTVDKAGGGDTTTPKDKATGGDTTTPKETGSDGMALDTKRQKFTSGSRVKAQYVNGEDGSRHFWGWWDTKLNKKCVWLDTAFYTRGIIESKSMYCQPQSDISLIEATYFSDAQCTVPIVPAIPPAQGQPSCGSTPSVTIVTLRNAQIKGCVPAKENYSCWVASTQESPLPDKVYFRRDRSDQCKEHDLTQWKDKGAKVRKMGEACSEENIFGKYAKGEIKTE